MVAFGSNADHPAVRSPSVLNALLNRVSAADEGGDRTKNSHKALRQRQSSLLFNGDGRFSCRAGELWATLTGTSTATMCEMTEVTELTA